MLVICDACSILLLVPYTSCFVHLFTIANKSFASFQNLFWTGNASIGSINEGGIKNSFVCSSYFFQHGKRDPFWVQWTPACRSVIISGEGLHKRFQHCTPSWAIPTCWWNLFLSSILFCLCLSFVWVHHDKRSNCHHISCHTWDKYAPNGWIDTGIRPYYGVSCIGFLSFRDLSSNDVHPNKMWLRRKKMKNLIFIWCIVRMWSMITVWFSVNV